MDVSCSDADLLDTIQRFPGDPNGFPFVVVAQGLVPREQSIHRAEVCAIIKTAEVAALAPQAEVEIHNGSTFALGEARKAVMGEDSYFPDLGAALQDVMQQRFKMCKVKAHANLDTLAGAEKCLAAGNHFADLVAGQTVSQDFQFLLDLQDEHAEAARRQTDSLFLFWRFLLDLSFEENRLKQQVAKAQGRDCEVVGTQVSVGSEEALASWCALSPSTATRYDIPDLAAMVFSSSLGLASSAAVASKRHLISR